MAYKYPIVYWNCANLISDSGGQDGTVKYDKIASAIGRLRKEGINIVPPYINEARFDFRPDAKSNRIIYGLKAISGVGAAEANAIVANQPYASLEDFYNKMQEYKNSADGAKFGDTTVIQLIKAGAFDSIENKPRNLIMENFIKKISSPINKIQLSNIEDLYDMGMLTESQIKHELRLYKFKNYVLNKNNILEQVGKSPTTYFYLLEEKYALPFFEENFASELIEGKDYKQYDKGIGVKRGSLEKVYEKLMQDFKAKITEDPKYLNSINEKRFKLIWNEKCNGSISKWEMDSMCYYYHEHELFNINRDEYSISNFDSLPEEPEVVDFYFIKGQSKARYKLTRLCGTVIGKDKNHNTVSLLTPDGVVTIKFYKGQFGFYDREISEVQEDGTKVKLDKSWFKRGTKLLITGCRMGEQFIPKKYKDSIYLHTVQLIKGIDTNNHLVLQSDRIGIADDADMAVRV